MAILNFIGVCTQLIKNASIIALSCYGVLVANAGLSEVTSGVDAVSSGVKDITELSSDAVKSTRDVVMQELIQKSLVEELIQKSLVPLVQDLRNIVQESIPQHVYLGKLIAVTIAIVCVSALCRRILLLGNYLIKKLSQLAKIIVMLYRTIAKVSFYLKKNFAKNKIDSKFKKNRISLNKKLNKKSTFKGITWWWFGSKKKKSTFNPSE